jgi:hypothetical protein
MELTPERPITHAVASPVTGVRCAVPEEEFSGPLDTDQDEHWDTWWNACQSSHKTYRLQGFKPGDFAGHYRHIRNGTQFRVEWSGEVPLHEAVHKACSRKCNKKKRKLGSTLTTNMSSSQQIFSAIDLDNLGEVQAYDFRSKCYRTVDLTGASRRMSTQKVGRGQLVYYHFYKPSFATEGFNSVTLGNATCKVFGGDQCSSCKCKRGLSKCKRAKLLGEIEYSSREWGELQVLRPV